jgi:hypothetical protein
MAYFKRNNENIKEVENIINNGKLSEEEKRSLTYLIDCYKNATFDKWEDRKGFYEESVSNMVNDMSFDAKSMAEKMSNDHPTLQQSFMKLCVKFIQKMAEKTCYDGRNERSVKMAQKMVSAMDDDYLPCI